MGNNDLTEAQQSVLARGVSEWEKAQFVFANRAWNGQPAARHFAEVLSGIPLMEARLVELLSHKNPLVSAYSLIALDLMDSPQLAHLPEALVDKRAKITTVMGSFHDKMQLGAFARQLRKRWLKRHPHGGKGGGQM